jgi:hypothetical protein
MTHMSMLGGLVERGGICGPRPPERNHLFKCQLHGDKRPLMHCFWQEMRR